MHNHSKIQTADEPLCAKHIIKKTINMANKTNLVPNFTKLIVKIVEKNINVIRKEDLEPNRDFMQLGLWGSYGADMVTGTESVFML